VYVSSRAGLVDAGVAMHVASRVRLVDARIATGIGGAVVSDFARLIDAAVAGVQHGGGPGCRDSKAQCRGYELD
jgi:hypothetical protein